MGTMAKRAKESETASDEVYEYEWKLASYSTVARKGSQVLNYQKLKIDTGKNDSMLQTKWEVGLKRDHDTGNRFFIYCKLLEIHSSVGCKRIKANIIVQLRDGKDRFRPLRSVVQSTKDLGVDEEFLLTCADWWKNYNRKHYVDYDDGLTFGITLYIVQPRIDPRGNSLNEVKFKSNSVNMLKRNIEIMMESAPTDLKIICSDGKEIECLQAILKSNCSVFKFMLESGLLESQTGIINVSDISSKTMNVLIRYLYTGDLLQTWDDPDIIVEFVYGAGKYQLTELLKYLDAVLGEQDREYPQCVLTSLLDITRKLSLQTACTKLANKIGKVATSSVGEEDESTDDSLT